MKGFVYLVGAGPGAPGLLTLRGAAVLQGADALVYDGLVSPSLIPFAVHAEKFYVGKSQSHAAQRSETTKNLKEKRFFASHHCAANPSLGRSGALRMTGPCTEQKKINRLLVQLARQGKKVVRLKGGDPFIFGRGGEEASYLKKAKIPFEIVPGVSAGYAAPAYAGIPVTDRRFSSSVTFVTAHENPEKKDHSADWQNIAKLKGTVVIFMGTKNLTWILQELIRHGKPAQTLASIIEWGTTARQRIVSGHLKNIASKAEQAGISSPAVIVLGEVNRLQKELDWFSVRPKPLSGKTVLVTRAQNQAGSLRMLLEEKGASVIEFPVIDFLPPDHWEPVDQAIQSLEDFDWIVFTSTNGVEFFWQRLIFLKKDARSLAGKKIAVIGEATSQSLRARGIVPDLIPPKFTSESLMEMMKKIPLQRKKVMLARTDIAPEFLQKALEEQGADVSEIPVYRTVSLQSHERKKALENWMRTRKIDFVTFTSSSTVKNFFELLSPKTRRQMKCKLISIGPVTSATLKEHGCKPYREAKEHTISGLVEAITKA